MKILKASYLIGFLLRLQFKGSNKHVVGFRSSEVNICFFSLCYSTYCNCWLTTMCYFVVGYVWSSLDREFVKHGLSFNNWLSIKERPLFSWKDTVVRGIALLAVFEQPCSPWIRCVFQAATAYSNRCTVYMYLSIQNSCVVSSTRNSKCYRVLVSARRNLSPGSLHFCV